LPNAGIKWGPHQILGLPVVFPPYNRALRSGQPALVCPEGSGQRAARGPGSQPKGGGEGRGRGGHGDGGDAAGRIAPPPALRPTARALARRAWELTPAVNDEHSLAMDVIVIVVVVIICGSN